MGQNECLYSLEILFWLESREIAFSSGEPFIIPKPLFQNPKILILDEATSALDAYSEYLVDKALKEISKDRTVLTIAHRLSTIQNADEVAVLENGVIVEIGAYVDLMAKQNGFFRDLMTHQAFEKKARNAESQKALGS